MIDRLLDTTVVEPDIKSNNSFSQILSPTSNTGWSMNKENDSDDETIPLIRSCEIHPSICSANSINSSATLFKAFPFHKFPEINSSEVIVRETNVEQTSKVSKRVSKRAFKGAKPKKTSHLMVGCADASSNSTYNRSNESNNQERDITTAFKNQESKDVFADQGQGTEDQTKDRVSHFVKIARSAKALSARINRKVARRLKHFREVMSSTNPIGK